MIHSLRDDVIHDSFTFFSRDSWFKIPLPPPIIIVSFDFRCGLGLQSNFRKIQVLNHRRPRLQSESGSLICCCKIEFWRLCIGTSTLTDTSVTTKWNKPRLTWSVVCVVAVPWQKFKDISTSFRRVVFVYCNYVHWFVTQQRREAWSENSLPRDIARLYYEPLHKVHITQFCRWKPLILNDYSEIP